MASDRFVLGNDHLKLLRAARVQWQNCETGAPEIDPRRPYGNSDVAGDVARILGCEVQRCPHCHEPLSEQCDEALMQAHRETETALQIVLALAGRAATTGVYKREHERGVWARCHEAT